MKTPRHTSIYQIPEQSTSVNPEGEGRKGLVVAIQDQDASVAEIETLQKMIAAIRYNVPEDTVIVKIPHGEKFALSAWGKEWKDLLVFGLKPSSLGFQLEYLSDKILFLEDRRVLFCPSLREINASIPKKQTLWRLLQEMFLNG